MGLFFGTEEVAFFLPKKAKAVVKSRGLKHTARRSTFFAKLWPAEAFFNKLRSTEPFYFRMWPSDQFEFETPALKHAAFHTKIKRAAILYLHFRFVLFWRKNIGLKAVLNKDCSISPLRFGLLLSLVRTCFNLTPFEISLRMSLSFASDSNMNWK